MICRNKDCQYNICKSIGKCGLENDQIIIGKFQKCIIYKKKDNEVKQKCG